MVFALGFLLCGLLTLLFLPAFWRRAVRLSVRRVEMQMPLSMSEIVAERDQLRAERQALEGFNDKMTSITQRTAAIEARIDAGDFIEAKDWMPEQQSPALSGDEVAMAPAQGKTFANDGLKKQSPSAMQRPLSHQEAAYARHHDNGDILATSL